MPQKPIVVIYMPTPVGGVPHLVDPSNQISFLHSVSVEIGSCRQQPHHQIRGFHHVSAVVQPVERYGLAAIAVDKMRVNSMIGVSFRQKVYDLNQPVQRCLAADPLPFHRYNGSQYPKSSASDCTGLRTKCSLAEIRLIVRLIDKIQIEIRSNRIAPFSRHAAVRMCIMPEIPERLTLDGLQQLFIGKIFDEADCLDELARSHIVFVEPGWSERLRPIDGKCRRPEKLRRNDKNHQQSFHLTKAFSRKQRARRFLSVCSACPFMLRRR